MLSTPIRPRRTILFKLEMRRKNRQLKDENGEEIICSKVKYHLEGKEKADVSFFRLLNRNGRGTVADILIP